MLCVKSTIDATATHPVCAASVASQHFLHGAATPPHEEGTNLESSIFNLQSSIFNLQSSIFNLQFSAFNRYSRSISISNLLSPLKFLVPNSQSTSQIFDFAVA